MHIPRATYRIQFCPDFGFQDAALIVRYLSDLGISDIYASPIFKARKGSTHGYDIVDPNQLNPELGEHSDFEALVRALKDNGMFWLQDIVPNHMAYSSENEWLMDVLESGKQSPYYQYFDIDWSHPYENLNGKIIAPVLGTFYADALEAGEITMHYDENGFSINYYQMKFPVRIESYATILKHNIALLHQVLSGRSRDLEQFQKVIERFETLGKCTASENHISGLTSAKDELRELYNQSKEVKEHLDATISFYNGQKGAPDSYNALDELLSRQRYRLAFWKVATEEINYRRFFTVNDLISINVEKEPVFAATHDMILKFVRDGIFSGLRIDHIDGLYDPEGYISRLRTTVPDCFIVVEKILGRDEQLPDSWHVEGTTGYDMLNQINGLFCRKQNADRINRIYNQFTGHKRYYGLLTLQTKQLIIGKHLAGSIDNLAQFLKKISSSDRHGRDITMYSLKRALVEVMAQFMVYRTYVTGKPLSENDRCTINRAVDSAKATIPAQQYELDFIRSFLLLEWKDSIPDDEKDQWVKFVMMFQQYTGPVMAKAVEDTLFYRYNRLVSLNEVGGEPVIFGTTIDEFHSFNLLRAKKIPGTLNASATHDTKRGEDVRARIHVLSELADEWKENLKAWKKNNRTHKTSNGPDGNDEYLIYQTLLGAWPFSDGDDTFIQRMKEYIVKAVREAKVHTAWIKPDTTYEDACTHFVEKILSASDNNPFLSSFLLFQKKVGFYGMFNSLSQTLLKATCPGIPDFYQGTELWDLSLVDPDNRRAVDYSQRIDMLGCIQEKAGADLNLLLSELLSTWQDGRVKLFLIYRLLQAGKKHGRLFQDGEYIPLKVEGVYTSHLIAFARRHGADWAVSIVPRFLTEIVDEGNFPFGADIWGNTSIKLPEGSPPSWLNVITGESIDAGAMVAAGDILRKFPVALIVNREES